MKTKINYQSGQALIIATLLFTIVAAVVIGSFVAPIVRTTKTTQDLVAGDRGYFLSESGAEDVAYRLKNAISVSPSEILTLDGNTVTTDITTTSEGKTISSVGNWQNRFRNLELKLTAGEGVAFNYGIQTGNGGFVLNGGSRVNGNVYANGPIVATNGVIITGSAVAADSVALSADQINDSPSTPPNNVVFGDANVTQDWAQSFQLSTSGQINKVEFYLKRTSNAPADATVRLVSDSAGSPSTSVLASGSLLAGNVGVGYTWVPVVFSSNPQLTAGTTYWLVIDATSNSSKYYTIGANSGVYANGTGKIGRYSSSSWSDTSPVGLDSYFKFYLGGTASTIGGSTYVGGVVIGSGGVGDAWANNVIGASVAGNLYCQTGSYNNKACDTSRNSPPTQPMPISEATIQAWKDEAQAGTTIPGNYTVGWAGTTTGPAYITGNLLVNGGGTLTLSGTVYVQGTITTTGGGKIKLASSYGANSGVLLSDGVINLAGGSTFSGSGQTGSYLLVLTTSDCPAGPTCGGLNALSVSGGAGAIVLNAQNGNMYLNGGVSAKEATAYKITASGGTTITYESGLADMIFSSGPSGGWNFSGWEETP